MELAHLIEDIEDETDPTFIEKLLVYQDELQRQVEEFIDVYFSNGGSVSVPDPFILPSEILPPGRELPWPDLEIPKQTSDSGWLKQGERVQLLVERLTCETVTWHQPWYQQTNSVTRRLENQSEEPFLTGPMTKAESARIEKNWKKFVKTYRLPNKPECFARWRNKTKSRNPNSKTEQVRKFVTAYLARGLQRNLYQVYHYTVNHFGAPNKGAYTEIEEKIMDVAFRHLHNKAISLLSVVLGREVRGINTRFHIYKGDSKLFERTNKKFKWTLPLATKFVKSLMEHSGLRLKKLKNARFDISVWRKVGEDMEHPHIYLSRFWENSIHPQLFVKYDVKLYRLRKKILKILLNSNYEVWGDIRWTEVKNQFPDGFTARFLYTVVSYLVRHYPLNYRTEPLTDVVTFGLSQLRHLMRSRDKRLRTLKLQKDGILEPVKYEEKLR